MAKLLELINKEIFLKVAFSIFIFFSIWWLILRLYFKPDSLPHNLFGGLYGLMALWGAICGVGISKKWGGFQSIMGKAMLMFSFGLFAQEFGQLVYFVYKFFLHVDVAYPSIGDIGFFGSIIFYIYGVFLLAKASGVKIALQSYKSKIGAIVIPIGMLLLSYFFFLQNYQFDWSKPLTIFLDFGYPMGQSIYISLAILTFLLSRGVLGGVMKNNIRFIILALVVQYISDYTFLYQAHLGTWSVGGINDYMYLVSYFLITIGLIQFKSIYKKLHATIS